MAYRILTVTSLLTWSIYAAELQLNKASVPDTLCLDLHISVADSFITTKIYGKRDDFDLLIFIPQPKDSGDIAMSLTSVHLFLGRSIT